MTRRQQHSGNPLLVTGLPRTGTSWVGKMLEASGNVVYINEPLNPQHPPGRSPGVLTAEPTHRFQYICAEDEGEWLPAFQRTACLRYAMLAELRRNRSPYDLARMGKYVSAFKWGQLRGLRALFDDPFAVLSTGWFVDRLNATAVVLIRDPVAVVGSWRRLGWTTYFHELLEQPLLVRDLLGPHAAQMRSLVGSQDHVAKIALLWNAVYDTIGNLASTHPGMTLVRYESLVHEPLSGFRRLYDACALDWDEQSEARVCRATSGGGAVQPSHAWTILGGLSRTAYRPMDGRKALLSYRDRLSESEIGRVRELTADVASRFYPGELDDNSAVRRC